MFDLRRQIEKQATDLGSAHRSLSDLRSKNAELEERLMQINKELQELKDEAANRGFNRVDNVAGRAVKCDARTRS